MVNEYTTGNHLKTNDSLKSLLSTATDKHLVQKQVYRADEPKDEVKILRQAVACKTQVYGNCINELHAHDDEIQQATCHCTASHADSPTTVLEGTHTATDTTTRCIGSLTTTAHLLRLSTPTEDTAVTAEVAANE